MCFLCILWRARLCRAAAWAVVCCLCALRLACVSAFVRACVHTCVRACVMVTERRLAAYVASAAWLFVEYAGCEVHR